MSKREISILAALTALSVAILAVAGRFTPLLLPDTPTYLHVLGFPAMLGQTRTPLYGWLVAALDLGGSSHRAVPFFQVATYVAAVWFAIAQLRRFGLSSLAVLSVGAALLFANPLLIDAGWIQPELLSITCALAAFAATVRLAEGPPAPWWAWLVAGAGAGCAYLLRPSFLPLIVALPLAYAALRVIRGDALRLARAAAVLAVTAAPFIGLGSLRAATVGDFNVVSYGGYVMSGVAALMLSDDVVARLPDDVRPFAAKVLAARRAGEDSGRMIGIPRNSSNERSFYSASLAYFDVLARTYDDMLNDIIISSREPNESWVDFNRRMMRFSLAVMRAAPGRYAAWIVGAATRTVGRSLVTNLPAALAIIVIAAAWTWHLFVRRKVGVVPRARLDVPVLAVLAVLWLLSAGVLTMLVIAPSTRYIDTSSVLVAPVLIYWAALLVAPTDGSAVSVARP